VPANLTQQYLKAEAAYRSASSPDEELACLQAMLREIPKHKGTDKLQADLKSKIARVKAEAAKPKKSTGPTTKIPKQGAGRILLIGPPNCGKSQLLASMTRATPEVADYPYTTQSPTPGMMHHEDCGMQLIDLPPVSIDVFDTEVLNLVRAADLVFLIVDLGSENLIEDTQAVLDRFQSSKTKLGRQTELDPDDIGTTFTHTLLVMNKSDADGAQEREALLDEFLDLPFDRLHVSATEPSGLVDLAREAFERLALVRVYTKNPKEKEPDMTKPFAIRRGQTLVEVAEQVHQSMADKLQSARVWGSQVHPGTTVKPDYEPIDGDVIELHAAN
jgi:hypothetical protein